MNARRGFTIFELLAVITIIGIVLSVTLGSFTGWGDAHAVRGSATVVQSALAQARDYAVTQRIPISFEYATHLNATNSIKKFAEFQLIRASSTAVATNATLAASDESAQLLGSVQRLPGNVWLLRRLTTVSSDDTLENYASDRFVFLPSGKVYAANDVWTFFIVSRKLRSDNIPCMIYRIDISSENGTATATKCDPDDASSYSP